MASYNANSALHATKKLLDNNVSREAFLQKLRSVITDPDAGVFLAWFIERERERDRQGVSVWMRSSVRTHRYFLCEANVFRGILAPPGLREQHKEVVNETVGHVVQLLSLSNMADRDTEDVEHLQAIMEFWPSSSVSCSCSTVAGRTTSLNTFAIWVIHVCLAINPLLQLSRTWRTRSVSS